MGQTKIRVVNSSGEEVAHNGIEIGDIIVKGQGTLQHAENRNMMKNGWIFTGDKGFIDEQGHIHVKEPFKDIPNQQGTISTANLEQILMKHPHIAETAITPLPHKELGEIAHAFIVLDNKSDSTKQDIINFCKDSTNGASYPQSITFVDELPKTPSGKILKVELQKWL